MQALEIGLVQGRVAGPVLLLLSLLLLLLLVAAEHLVEEAELGLRERGEEREEEEREAGRREMHSCCGGSVGLDPRYLWMVVSAMLRRL